MTSLTESSVLACSLHQSADLQGKLKQFGYNYQLDKKEQYYRLSNEVITGLLQMRPESWRIFEQLCKKIDVYPLDLLNSPEFIKAFNEGKAVVPESYRTVTLYAKDYIRDYKLSPNTGYREFTLNALSLFDEVLSSVSFSSVNGLLKMGLSHPVSDITFHVQQKKAGENTIASVHRDMMKEKGWTRGGEGGNKFWSAASITLVLHEKLAMEMLLLNKYFTRIDGKITRHLTKAGSKLYSLLQMTANSTRPECDGWSLALDLEQCNKLMDTKYKSIAQFSANFKLPKELTEKTDFDVLFEKDIYSKIGKKFTRIILFFSKKSAVQMEMTGVKKLERPRLPPRPRVRKASHAEGEWARRCMAILVSHQKKLEAVNRVLPKADRDRLVRYRKIIGEAV
ncbi:replication initiation protein [Vibrio sp. Of7-15]|uniref:replication initiation protein n=1 Tax=Vibrio sp. Of7-15 TaxID=2724879 RepID=UPI001EF1E5F3|nr:replication initiation protein [Vibrio sp. Of7-15]MCG7500116.1 replication initiation protein [Vibrio sp. Of7-15]